MLTFADSGGGGWVKNGLKYADVILARTTKGKDHQVLITILWRNFELHSDLQIQLELILSQIFSSFIIN